MSKIITPEIFDNIGVRKNISEILELLRNNNLTDIYIAYRRKDKSAHFFQNGDDYVLMGMLMQQVYDISTCNEGIVEHIYSKNLNDNNEDKD